MECCHSALTALHDVFHSHIQTSNAVCTTSLFRKCKTIPMRYFAYPRNLLPIFSSRGGDLKPDSNETLTPAYTPLPASSSLSSSACLGHVLRENIVTFCFKLTNAMKYTQTIMRNVTRLSFALEDSWLQEHCVMLPAGRQGVIALVIAMVLFTNPTFTVTNGSIQISDNMAIAQPVGQIRQAALFLERFVGGSTSSKVLDKVVTVISGQTMVTPDTVDQLKAVIDGERSPQDWLEDLADSAENFLSTTLDVISHFDPLSLIETTGTSIQGFVEVAAERFAAFELSTLVALGERWILWAPFVVLPMYWQMTRNRKEEKVRLVSGETRDAAVQLSEEVVAKAEKVRDELERIELKASLLDMVYSLGKPVWQSSTTDQLSTRKQIDELLARLQELNPTKPMDLGLPLAQSTQIEPTYNHSTLEVEGEWSLIYVSQAPSTQNQETQLSQFLNLALPGVELGNMRQKLWKKVSKSSASLAAEKDVELMMAKNTAFLKFGPLGVVEVSVRGSWENLKNGKVALVSFDTFSARPVEVLGTVVREDLPPLDISIPRTFQTSGEWETVYLDNSLRINRGRTGQLYLLRKAP